MRERALIAFLTSTLEEESALSEMVSRPTALGLLHLVRVPLVLLHAGGSLDHLLNLFLLVRVATEHSGSYLLDSLGLVVAEFALVAEMALS